LRWLFCFLDWMLRSDARLTRFIFQQNQFHAGQRTIGHRAFLPPRDNKLSVFATNKLREKSVWAVGRRIAAARKRNLHARADIPNYEVEKHRLQVIRDEPPRRHRNVVGWPSHAQKDDLKLIAMELAAVAKLRLPV
jgi:hypothetical protein